MREMDLLFNEYVKENFEQLDASQHKSLESLLNEADLDIMNWIMGRAEPDCPEYTPIIDCMRKLKNKHIESN